MVFQNFIQHKEKQFKISQNCWVLQNIFPLNSNHHFFKENQIKKTTNMFL